MKQKYVCPAIQFLLISTMCAVSASAQDADISFSEIFQAVRKNVDFLKENIIDLLSSEEITIEEFNDSGKTTKTTNIISEYRIFPEIKNSIHNCRVIYDITESLLPTDILREERVLLSAKENGKTQRLDKYEFSEHFLAKGSSYVDFFILFDEQNEKCFNYELKGVEKLNGRDVYVIEIKQRNADVGTKHTETIENIFWNIKYEGSALIDAETMEIVQLKRDGVSLNYRAQRNGSSPINEIFPYVTTRYVFFTQYEYEKVKIKDQYLNLPGSKTVRLFRENGQLYASYKYRYGNYMAFTVDTKILFDAIDE